ncbi:hypothetical protein [Rhodococcus sp. KBS0724]|uniref:hypothetical protein n=1 Tax=Rhodococcus sp. KBS0724 TaxID=1179674 RepID=UPI0021B10B28|nr:hypothetical protein [Rhodococcus sp. KBS0724]
MSTDVDTDTDIIDLRPGKPASPLPRYGWNPRICLRIGVAVAVAMFVLNLAVAADIADVVPAPIRLLIALAGMTLVPGLPVVVALRIPGRALSAALIVSVSLAVAILASQLTMVAQWWSPLRTQFILALLALALCAAASRTVPSDYRLPSSDLQRLRTFDRSRAIGFGALLIALILFVVAAARLDVTAAGHFGIITEIGPIYVLGLVTLCGTIVYTLRRRLIDHVLMAANIVMLIVYTTMLVPVSTGETTVPVAFVHRGFINILAQSGTLPNSIDARFSWAGFFSAGAHLITVADVPDATVLLLWAPLYMGALLAFPLYAIAIAITGRVRLAWLAVVIYQLFNWYQQDYFAPQAVATIFYTTILATLLWQLRRSPLPVIGSGIGRFIVSAPRRTPGFVPGFDSLRTLAVGAVLLLLIVATTVSHQITPILVIVVLASFSLFGATRYRTLWLAAGLVFAAWFSYGATDFWIGHLQSIFSEIGQVGNSVGRGVSERITGDPTYQQMQYLRMGASGLLAMVAFVGWVLSRHRRTWLVAGAVAAAPFSLVLLQSYGGEMIIRCFVLASPVLAPFAAIALAHAGNQIRKALNPVSSGNHTQPSKTRPSHWVGAAAATLALVSLGLLLTTNRGLNTAFEASTTDQVTVSDQFIAAVPPSTTIMTWSHASHTNGVRRTLDPLGPRMMFVDSYDCANDLSGCALARDPMYVYVTSQGIGMALLQQGMTQEYLDAELAAIIDSGLYVPMIEKPSITILRRVDAPAIEFESP